MIAGRTTLRRAAVVASMLALVVLAAWQNRQLSAIRRAGLPEAPAYALQAPPLLTFLTVGLGGFRGIAAEVLWARADRLQDEGRYLELVQLADWITRLDPHATEAWAYNAWNLSYNISAMMSRPQDRLRWVAYGIMLLRDDGLPANPHNARLYRELAWLYQHKIGSSDDEAHLTYKLALAQALAPYVRADGTVSDDTPDSRAELARQRLDPARMRALERQFGPLDWRLAQSHAVYWASLGLEHATGHERLACRRAIYQPLLVAVAAGRFEGDIASGEFRAAPNPALVPATARFLEETAREYPTHGVRVACGRFLAGAICWAHATGRTADEQAWYRDLQAIGAGVLQPLPLADLLQGREPKAL